MGIRATQFWTRSSSESLRHPSAPVRRLVCAVPNDGGSSSWPLRPRMCDRHPRQRLLPCCARWRDRRTLDDPRGRRPVPAPAWRLRRLRPPPMVIALRRLEVGATVKAEKRCRTATAWPIALCSIPLVGFPNQAVMTASEGVREHILSTPSSLAHIRSRLTGSRVDEVPVTVGFWRVRLFVRRGPGRRNDDDRRRSGAASCDLPC